mgnify:FL=1
MTWGEIFRLADERKNFIIVHCQMLGVGTDLPCLNCVTILGNKNKSDLFQTIMRGCRVDYNNPEKKRYHVFVYVPDEVKAYMQEFVNTLDELGGPKLIEAFSNDCLQGEAVHNNDPLFTALLSSKAIYNQVEEEYQQIINCSKYNKQNAANTLQIKYLTYFAMGDIERGELMRTKWLNMVNNTYLKA